MLKALRAAVANTLDRKQKLGQYAVIWQNGRPVKTDGAAPKAEKSRLIRRDESRNNLDGGKSLYY